MNEKNDLNQLKEQLLSSINRYCSNYLNENFMDKCKKLTFRLCLKEYRILSWYPKDELAASIIYTAGESENPYTNEGQLVCGRPGLKFLSNFYGILDCAISTISKNIKEMLCIDEIHTLGVPNYTSPLLNIRVLGFGKEGIESINRISRFNLDNIYISGICVSEQDLNNLNAGNSILLESNKNGSITADCIIRLESIARSADVVLLMLDPNKIDGLEGQALGFLGESYALRICALLGEKSYNTLMVKLLSNGMDAIMPCTISDESYRLVYKLIDTLSKFPIYKETLSQVDFYEIKMLLKNSGVIQTAWEKSSGLNRCINAAAKCLSIVDKINVKKLFIKITGPFDLGLGETREAAAYIKNELGQNTQVISDTCIDEFLNNEVEVFCLFIHG